ncbi:hypothetical protein LZ633_09800 [Enterobacter asburiae]|nr:hypothetical protein [Enterobacter asburiae]
MEWIFGGVVLLVIIGAIFKPSRCDICGISFKKKYHTWTIEGKKQHLCPNCNGKMNRRVSSQKFKDKFG